MIALQETRLSNDDSQRKNGHFIRSVYANARVFWSPISEASGHNDVGLILSSHHPFGPIVNVTSHHMTSISQSMIDIYYSIHQLCPSDYGYMLSMPRQTYLNVYRSFSLFRMMLQPGCRI